MYRMSRRLLQPSLAENWASAGLLAKDAGVRIVKLAKTSDTHLRVLEERLTVAEAQRLTLWSRLQSAANESDHEATAEAYRRNTSELLQMYREHKIKRREDEAPPYQQSNEGPSLLRFLGAMWQADSMLFTVLALFGGSIFTLAGSLIGHYRSQQQADELGAKLEHRLKEGLGRAMDLSMDVALEMRVAAAVESAISRVETNRLMSLRATTRTNSSIPPSRATETRTAPIGTGAVGVHEAASARRHEFSNVDDHPWWMPLPLGRLVDLLWHPHENAAVMAPRSEIKRARSEAATWAAAAVYLGYVITRN